ncbi:MAG TPA: iron-sulfur cluster assembly protein [Candidatus Dormibacteraeota bacterium]|nr:iron-sulfur cluster assembly protein [Candidatus Dormibacteraeota bacterium]
MTSSEHVNTVERVMRALDGVIDPELDEPITTLRFVSDCAVSPDGDVSVRLRLPTPQCAPNFAFLMAADARRAVRDVPGVRDVAIVLEDHLHRRRDQRRPRAGGGLHRRFSGRDDRRRSAVAARVVHPQGAGRPPGCDLRGAARRGGRSRGRGGAARA